MYRLREVMTEGLGFRLSRVHRLREVMIEGLGLRAEGLGHGAWELECCLGLRV